MAPAGAGQDTAQDAAPPYGKWQPIWDKAPANVPYHKDRFETWMDNIGKVLGDPRNAWIGLGPMAGVVRPAGWGAEVLRRYKLLGGTPETLSKTLGQRGADPRYKDHMVRGFRRGTDIAAPAPDRDLAQWMTPQEQTMASMRRQLDELETAGVYFEAQGQGLRKARQPRFESRYMDAAKQTVVPLESNTSGNAAYNAISSRMGRIMNSPEFKFRKSEYTDLPPVSDAEYYNQLPIQAPHRKEFGGQYHRYLQAEIDEVNERARRYNFGRTGAAE